MASRSYFVLQMAKFLNNAAVLAALALSARKTLNRCIVQNHFEACKTHTIRAGLSARGICKLIFGASHNVWQSNDALRGTEEVARTRFAHVCNRSPEHAWSTNSVF